MGVLTVVMLVIGSDDVLIIDEDVRGSDELCDAGSDEDGEITVCQKLILIVTINNYWTCTPSYRHPLPTTL